VSIAAVCRAGLATWAAVWLIAATIGGRPAAAQDGVTCGITSGPDGNMINLGQCGPAPPVHYGAVAISPSTLIMGSSHGRNSRSDAEQAALQNCQSNGGRDCVVEYWAGTDCLALAATPTSPGAWGAASGHDRASAAAAALKQCDLHGKGCAVRVTPCGGDDVRWPSPLPLPPGNRPGSVDPNLVGTWTLLINPGYWVWEIGRDGTYTFYSEAPDGAPTHMGTFAAGSGHYSLHSTNIPLDNAGTYRYQAPGTLVLMGPLGTSTWYRK
jgi:Domain of unknown function (DUF4189)